MNIYTSGGQTRARKANASDMSKPANAFAPKAVGNGEAGLFHFVGQIISDLSGLTPGTSYYLDTTGGGLTATPPSIEGQGVQLVGVALSATSFLFSPQPMVEFN
ncbi:hypothetical protein [Sphingobium chungbukense]|uniref:hypothetical protein n=1 Tax=Sphingobium chungbukense TaxID=56193 RepID=UPI000699E108|nr:hypothetical protein [Sphingobium chungbukense]